MLGKNSFTEGSFLQASRNKVRKRKVVYKKKVIIRNSAIKCYHGFHLRSHKGLEMLTLATSFFLLTKVYYSDPR